MIAYHLLSTYPLTSQRGTLNPTSTPPTVRRHNYLVYLTLTHTYFEVAQPQSPSCRTADTPPLSNICDKWERTLSY
ncbi:hypothetical protein LZ32DRAFT_349602 [Colletotrichum eremochloae]|nr:hypothetical protein LZ32DRAFT_349602 [Colletotrichum eremochloae]